MGKEYAQLVDYIRKISPVAVAFSGGVDSSLVAKAACNASERAIAVTVNDATVSKNELKNAKKAAKAIGIKHMVVNSNKLSEDFCRNDSMRCYFCKKTLFHVVKNTAAKHKITNIIDGSNADDTGDYRPGLLAAKEEKVVSPLMALGFGKEKIRKIAKSVSLPNWNKQQTACLSSRIPTGEKITSKKLRKVESAEALVRSILNPEQLRVRVNDGEARIEVGKWEREKMFNIGRLDRISNALKRLGFKRVYFDIGGYGSGS